MESKQIAATIEREFPVRIEWLGEKSFMIVFRPGWSSQEVDRMRPGISARMKELMSGPTLEDTSFEDIANSYKAMETALQLLTGVITNLRTELLVIKAEVVAQHELIERLTQQKMSRK